MRVLTSLAPWVLLVLIWFATARLGLVNQALLPQPQEIASLALAEVRSGSLIAHILVSSRRVVTGVLLGAAAALPIGFCLGWYPAVRRFANPLINFFRALPPIALIPLVIVYFGIGELSKVVVIFYSAFFASVIVIYEGIAQISPIYVRVAQTLGASEREIFARVVTPLALPHVLTALRVALGVGWATLVASELIAPRHGLGSMIQEAASFFRLDLIYLGIICIGATALVMDGLLKALSRHVLRWQERVAA